MEAERKEGGEERRKEGKKRVKDVHILAWKSSVLSLHGRQTLQEVQEREF